MTDRLSSLPFELLAKIWDMAFPYGSTSCPAALVCSYLLPHQRSTLFHMLDLHSITHLHRTYKRFKEVPSLPTYVKLLFVGGGLVGHQCKPVLKLVLATLVNAKEVFIGNFAFVEPFFSEPEAAFFPKMESMLVTGMDVDWEALRQEWRAFSQFTALRSLQLNFTTRQSRSIIFGTREPDFVMHTKLESLSLSVANSDSVDWLLKALPQLVRLELNSDGATLRAQLESAPTSLKDLSIHSPTHAYEVFEPMDALISRFTQLTSLRIASRHFTSTIFQYLRDPLPLKLLDIGYNVLCGEEDLRKLFVGRSRLSSLRELRADVNAPRMTVHGAREIVRLAGENGCLCTGGFFEQLHQMKDYAELQI